MSKHSQEESFISGGGVTGGRDGIHNRILTAVSDSLVYLDDLRPEPTQLDAEKIERTRILIRSCLTELLGELSLPAGPRIPRVDEVFETMLDLLAGLQELIHDNEEESGSFQALADQAASLYRSWNNTQQLLGLQMSILTKQLQLVREGVDEVTFAMNADGIGPADRQIMILRFDAPGLDEETREQEPMSLDNLLEWAQTFAAEGAQREMSRGGGFILRSRIAPAAVQLGHLIRAAIDDGNPGAIPQRQLTPRITRAMSSLATRLDEVAWNC